MLFRSEETRTQETRQCDKDSIFVKKATEQPIVVETVSSDDRSLDSVEIEEASPSSLPEEEVIELTPMPFSDEEPVTLMNPFDFLGDHNEQTAPQTMKNHDPQPQTQAHPQPRNPFDTFRDEIEEVPSDTKNPFADILDIVTETFSPWGLPNFFSDKSVTPPCHSAKPSGYSRRAPSDDDGLAEMTSVECTLEESQLRQETERQTRNLPTKQLPPRPPDYSRPANFIPRYADV